MRTEDLMYHRIRERHCREMAELALDPDVRRRHEELANLHASRAALNGASAARPTFSAT
jgi:hypothetical protein